MKGPGREINAALLALLVITTLSGVAAFGTGSEGPAGALVAVHGAAGIGLLLLAPAKASIVRRGLRRPGRSRKVISCALVVLVLAAVASGFLHALGGFRGYLGLLPMQIHVGAAVVALAVLGGHLWAHRRRPPVRPTDLDRRVALRGAGLGAGAAALWLVAPGRERRATGSHEVGSGAPAAMPVTQWMFDPVPRIAPARWRLRTPVGALDVAALAALPQRTERAVLDCTGGWWAEQEWRGVPLSALGLGLGLGGARAVDVVSATGYRRRLPPATPTNCCWPRTWAGVRSRRATAGPPASSRRVGAGSGG
jgi:hypothetical protein